MVRKTKYHYGQLVCPSVQINQQRCRGKKKMGTPSTHLQYFTTCGKLFFCLQQCGDKYLTPSNYMKEHITDGHYVHGHYS